MVERLPRWTWPAAGLMAVTAGAVNAVGLMGFQHEMVSHLTGNTTQLARAVMLAEAPALLHYAGLIGAFVAGAVAAGAVLRDVPRVLDARYALTLLGTALLLIVAIPMFVLGHPAGMYCAAAACGLQNATATVFSQGLVRTSHVSGMFTDLGIALGRAFRGVGADALRLRLWLCGVVIAGFLVGGAGAVWLHGHAGAAALLFPAMLAAGLGLGALRAARRAGR